MLSLRPILKHDPVNTEAYVVTEEVFISSHNDAIRNGYEPDQLRVDSMIAE